MRVGVIGAGSMGAILARHLATLGHQVSIANSRGPESLTAVAAEIGATPVSVVDAAKAGELVVIAIPTKAVADLPRALFANVPGSVIVIDIGNYHPELRDGRIDVIDRGMLDSQWVAQQIGRPVIKAFNNIFAKSLLEKGLPRGTKGRIALPVAGDSWDAKAAVLRLVDDLASTLSMVVIWAIPGGSSPERRRIARTLKPLLSGERSLKLIEAGLRITALNRRLASDSLSQRRRQKDEGVCGEPCTGSTMRRELALTSLDEYQRLF